MRPRRRIPFILPGATLAFPDPRAADPEGLVAIGGDLSPERLLLAYEHGIFPWYNEGLPPMWWSPDPRAIMDRDHLHVSRSMRRILRSEEFTITHDHAFEAVMRACGEDREGGTWILPEMVDAYVRLHELGHAHSLEVWQGTELVGGIYGVQRGALFAAESMFHRVPNASKVALIRCIERYFAVGVELFDVQFLTSHLESLGSYEISRDEYLVRVVHACRKRADVTFSNVH